MKLQDYLTTQYLYTAIIIAIVSLYVLTPVDLIPAKLGLLGYLDDAIFILLGYLVIKKIHTKHNRPRRKR